LIGLEGVSDAGAGSFFDAVEGFGGSATRRTGMDAFHSFLQGVGAFGDAGSLTLGNSGYVQLNIPGSYFGRTGVFEIGKVGNDCALVLQGYSINESAMGK
jgi:hypothetical protein